MRRSTLLAATAALTLTAPRRAFAADPIRVGISTSEESSLLFTASERGAFKDAGLDVAVTAFPPNQLMQGLLGGSLDVGLSNTGAILQAHEHALPLYLIAPAAVYSPRQPISHIVVAPASPIRGARDLSGKTIGVLAVKDMVQSAFMQWVDANGGDSKALHFVEVAPAAQAATVVAGRVDVVVMNEPNYTNAKGTVRQIGLTYTAVAGGKPFQATGVTANKAWADANPALLRRLAGAIGQTARWANRNPGECATYVSKLMKIDTAVLATIPRVRWGETPSAGLVQPVVDVMAKYGILAQRFSAGDVFAPGILA